MSAGIEIRSYRRVFDLERRIYSIDQLRLNPGGIPVRGVVYFAALLLVGLALRAVPAVGAVLGLAPWYARYVLLPGALATFLSVIRVEGRTFHHAALALARFHTSPRRVVALRRCARVGERWFPHEILSLPDGSDARLRKLRYTGPGAVLVLVEHRREELSAPAGSRGLARRAHLSLSGDPRARRLAKGKVIALNAGTSLLVRGQESG
ncbi:MAG TPA: hypothetical protein VGY13_05850 [Solirubrobacteraceae bacterium]|jgi:hypothetical protein|nr:hypothetical protein [Solirubrobacteraceae bacterium]